MLAKQGWMRASRAADLRRFALTWLFASMRRLERRSFRSDALSGFGQER